MSYSARLPSRSDYLEPRQRVFLTATPRIGPNPEPDITSKEFLESYLDVGVWMRVAVANDMMRQIESATSSSTQRVASIAAFYQQSGMAVEDALTMLLAWSIWSCEKDASLPNILMRTSLRLTGAVKLPEGSYVEEIRQ